MTPAEAKTKYREPFVSRVWTLMAIADAIVIGGYLIWHYFFGDRGVWAWSAILCLIMAINAVVFIGDLRAIFRNKGFKIFCDHCKKYIDPEMAWTCGYCDTRNRSFITQNTFLDKCVRCAQAPHSIVCLHCGKQSYLDGLKIAENPAWSTNVNVVQKVSPDEARANELADLEHKKKKIKLTAELIKEEVDLTRIEQVKVSTVEKPLRERLEESLASYRDRNIGVADIVRRELIWAEKEYSNNPDELERYKLMMDSWRDEHIQ